MPRLKDLLKNCYPKVETDPMPPHSLDPLLKFLAINPKCPEAAKWLQSKIEKDLKKKRFNSVKISISLMTKMVESNSTTLATYFKDVVKSMEQLFAFNFPNDPNSVVLDIKTDTMKLFCQVLDSRFKVNATEVDLNVFIPVVLDLANSSAPEPLRKKLRTLGLRGLKQYIFRAQDLDHFVNLYIDHSQNMQHRVIPTILDNLLAYLGKIELAKLNDMASQNIEDLSVECYRCFMELSRDVSAITTQSVLIASLEFIDSRQLWETEPQFPSLIFQSIAQKRSTTSHLVLSSVLAYLGDLDNIKVQTILVDAMTNFLGSEKITLKPIIEILTPLVRVLKKSKSKDEDLLNKHHKAVINCVLAVTRTISELSERFEAVSFILRQVPDSGQRKSLLLDTVLQILQMFVDLPSSTTIPASLLEPLETLSHDKDPYSRWVVQQIYHRIITMAVQLPTVNQLLETARSDLFNLFLIEDNEPPNFVQLFKTLCLGLKFHDSKDLNFSIPFVFALEDKVKNGGLKPHFSRALHSVVAAYLKTVASTFSISGLEEMIAEEMKDEWSYAFAHKNDFFAKKSSFSSKEINKAHPVSRFLDSEKICSLISKAVSIDLENLLKPLPNVTSKRKNSLNSSRSRSIVLETVESGPTKAKKSVQFRNFKDQDSKEVKNLDFQPIPRQSFNDLTKTSVPSSKVSSLLSSIQPSILYLQDSKSLSEISFPVLTRVNLI